MAEIYDYNWEVPSVGDYFPVTLGGTSDVTVPVDSSRIEYDAANGIDGLLGAFDRVGASALKLADSYASLSLRTMQNENSLKLAEIGGNVEIARANAALKNAQGAAGYMPQLTTLTNRMSGTEAFMLIATLVGVGVGIFSLLKQK